MTATDAARAELNARLARTHNTYVVMVALTDGTLREETVYAYSGDIARRQVRRRRGVRAVGTIRRTHIKGRPVS